MVLRHEHQSGFEIFSTTADAGLEIWSHDLKGLFIQAGLALSSLMTDLKHINVEQSFSVSVRADTIEELLVNWLNEIIYLTDVKDVFIKEFNIQMITHQEIKAELGGEAIDPNKHFLLSEVKAATYHNLLVTEKNGCYCATIIVDL